MNNIRSRITEIVNAELILVWKNGRRQIDTDRFLVFNRIIWHDIVPIFGYYKLLKT